MGGGCVKNLKGEFGRKGICPDIEGKLPTGSSYGGGQNLKGIKGNGVYRILQP